jgi:serine/threonine protein phosphatase 1
MGKPVLTNAPPVLEEGLRIYAVGDIHGRADLLRRLLLRIDQDLEENPAARTLHVFLGDYIDRGQDSAGVLDLLIERSQAFPAVCLKGNHEAFLLEFLRNPRILRLWAPNGGLATLASYGLKPPLHPAAGEEEKLVADLRAAMPERHSQFLAGLELSFTCGDYFFAHAGVRPGTPLSCQRQEDLLWIRDDFLQHQEPFEKIIVHGHTPVMEPEVRPNRINIDTGAYATGRLTCLRLERDKIEFL